MKKLIACLVVSLVAACSVIAQDYKPTSDYGFTYTRPVGSSFVWTNDNAYPFKISAMTFGLPSTATTNSVTRIHNYKVSEYVGDTVVTSLWGTVTTNYDYTITNTVSYPTTNTLLVATNALSTVYDIDDIAQIYIQHGDILTWTFSGTTTNILIWDAIR